MKKRKYNTGGDISSVLGAASPLLSLIPGAQALAGPLSAFGALTSALSPMFESSGDKRIGRSPGAYADGGDLTLSNQSFQVKGNPNVYDSESYRSPKGRINLDHNEVIKGSFAFSNRLRNPATGNTFAEDVAPIEKSTGKASKRAILAHDPIANNTITQNEQRAKTIANTQELLAMLMGKRKNGMDPKNAKALGQAYQSGGAIFSNQNFGVQSRTIPDTSELLQHQPIAVDTVNDINSDVRNSLLQIDPNVYSLSSEQFSSKLRNMNPEAYKMAQRAKYGANTIDDNLLRDSHLRFARQRELASRPRERANGGSFQSGGSITPLPGNPYMDMGSGWFYDPYDDIVTKRSPLSGEYKPFNQEFSPENPDNITFERLPDGKIRFKPPTQKRSGIHQIDYTTIDPKAHLAKYPDRRQTLTPAG